MDSPVFNKRTYANAKIKLSAAVYLNSTAGMGLAGRDTSMDVSQVVISSIQRGLVPWDDKSSANSIYVVVARQGAINQSDCE